jgi:hypothetical protein
MIAACRLARKAARPPHPESVEECAPNHFRAGKPTSAVTILHDACSLACLTRHLLPVELHISHDRSVPIATTRTGYKRRADAV